MYHTGLKQSPPNPRKNRTRHAASAPLAIPVDFSASQVTLRENAHVRNTITFPTPTRTTAIKKSSRTTPRAVPAAMSTASSTYTWAPKPFGLARPHRPQFPQKCKNKKPHIAQPPNSTKQRTKAPATTSSTTATAERPTAGTPRETVYPLANRPNGQTSRTIRDRTQHITVTSDTGEEYPERLPL